MKKKLFNKKHEHTQTYGKNEPEFTMAHGHVSLKTFEKMFIAEGWHPGDFKKSDLKYEYWLKTKEAWIVSCPENKKSIPVTVVEWN